MISLFCIIQSLCRTKVILFVYSLIDKTICHEIMKNVSFSLGGVIRNLFRMENHFLDCFCCWPLPPVWRKINDVSKLHKTVLWNDVNFYNLYWVWYLARSGAMSCYCQAFFFFCFYLHCPIAAERSGYGLGFAPGAELQCLSLRLSGIAALETNRWRCWKHFDMVLTFSYSLKIWLVRHCHITIRPQDAW